jgi:uncharacterized protein (DUF488 family)
VSMPQANRLSLPSASVKQQIESKGFWNDCRSAETANFFTIGYTGRKTEVFLTALEEHGVSTLVDVRQNAISMYRPELSKRNLTQLLADHGIGYIHCPELGVPRDIRAKAIETGSRDVIWDWYDENVASTFIGNNLHFFFNAFDHPIALMCTELDPQECHRHRLCLALEHLGMRGFDL